MKRQSAEQTGVDGDFLWSPDPDVLEVWVDGVQQVVMLVRDDNTGNAQDSGLLLACPLVADLLS